ncbi:MAG: hypothetical protein AABY75_05470 [Bacteroidota bacterium]
MASEQENDEPRERTPQEWVAYVDRLYDSQKDTRYQLEKQWFLHVAYYLGLHYFSWSEKDRNLKEPQVPSYRVRLVVNYILSTIETALAKLLKNKPILFVKAASESDEDRAAAKLSERVLEYLWEFLKIPRKLHDLGKWFLCCGTAFVRVYWDSRAGEMWQDTVQEGQQPQDLWIGEVACEVVSPFEVILDPACKLGVSDARWVMRQKMLPVDDIKAWFPEVAQQISEDSQYTSENLADTRFLGLVQQATARGQQKLDGHVLVREVIERPSNIKPKERMQWPQGRIIQTAGRALLSVSPPPDEGIEMPWIQFDALTAPGRAWGIGFVELIASLNRAYNRGRSKLLENIALHSSPKWVVDTNSGVSEENIDSEPSEVIRYTGGTSAPQQISPPSLMGNGFMQSLQQDQNDINEISGMREVSRGNAPAGVTSGVALRMLEEKDDTRFGLIVARFEQGLAELGSYMLKIVKANYIEPRLVKLRGDGGYVDAQDFVGADLRESVDVGVEAGSGLPTSKIARQAFVMDLWDKSILPRDNLKLVWKLMDLGNVQGLYDEELADVQLADEENRRMKRGMQQPVLLCYDHDIHIARHELEQKKGGYANLDPMVQQMLVQHIAQHRQMKLQKAIRDMQEQQQLQQAQQQMMGPPEQPQSNSQPPPENNNGGAAGLPPIFRGGAGAGAPVPSGGTPPPGAM